MRGSAFALAASLACLGAPAVSSPDPECLAPLLAEEVAAKRVFQAELARLIAREAPVHERLARIAAELQIALAERRAAQTRALARWGSDALSVPEDLDGYAWTAEDEARLGEEDPDYAGLSDEVAFLGSRNNADPGWPALRAAYRERIVPLPEHEAIVGRLLERTSALEPRFAACFDD